MNLELTPSNVLTHDQFLYSVRQALEARTTKSGFDSHLRYEPFLFQSFRLPEPTLANFKRDMKSVVQHAFEASPQFRREEEISIETISFFSLSIATLVADFETLLRHYGSAPLPVLEGVAVPKRESDSFPELEKLFQRFTAFREDKTEDGTDDFVPFRRTESDTPHEASLEKDIGREFWGFAFYLIRKTFPIHHKAILEFLTWHFQPEQAPKQIDWRIRPPVGDAFQQFLRSLQSGGRAGAQFSTNARGGDRSGGSRPPQRQPHGPRRDAGHPRSEDEAKPERPKNTERNASPSRPPRQTERGAPTAAVEASPEVLEAALEEVTRSAKILEKNSRRPGIRLKPQNSFVRRKQHMQAAELGIETESVGEGKDRAVYLKNKSK